MTTPTFTLTEGKCPKCKKKTFVAQNGLCLKCIAKMIPALFGKRRP